jgi:hypothetical protein
MDEASSGSYLDYKPLQLEFGLFPGQKVRGLGLEEPNALLAPRTQRRPMLPAERRRAVCGAGGVEDFLGILESS